MDEAEYLEHYKRSIRSVEPLDAETERGLLAKARAGDRDAHRKVVWSYLDRAFHLAQKVKPEWMSPLEAAQEANIALTKLVEGHTVPDIGSVLEPAMKEWFEKRVPRARPENES